MNHTFENSPMDTSEHSYSFEDAFENGSESPSSYSVECPRLPSQNTAKMIKNAKNFNQLEIKSRAEEQEKKIG